MLKKNMEVAAFSIEKSLLCKLQPPPWQSLSWCRPQPSTSKPFIDLGSKLRRKKITSKCTLWATTYVVEKALPCVGRNLRRLYVQLHNFVFIHRTTCKHVTFRVTSFIKAAIQSRTAQSSRITHVAVCELVAVIK